MAGLPAIYKRYQGQYTRGITAAALAAVLLAVSVYTYTLLAKYVQRGDSEAKPVKNVDESWVFAKVWPDADDPVYSIGDPVTEQARERLAEAQVARWEFKPARPVPYALYIHYGVPVLMLAAGALGIYLLMNMPRLADFLIATEGEMKKVSWSSRAELVGSTIVVIVTVALLGILIYVADFVWITGFKLVGVLPSGG